jgi:peptidoglycan/LPS O-acetylase OafA/YrhL
VPGSEATAAAAAAALSSGQLLESAAVVARTVIGLPGYRLDVLLFVTGLVLCLARPVPARTFLSRRARSILPNYWIGSLAAATLLVLLACLRTTVMGTPFADELHDGMRLGAQPYHFEPLDILRSLSIGGRLETPRTMQVVAPSMWYLMLIAQFYVVFPVLRWLLHRTGPAAFLAVCFAIAVGTRALAFTYAPSVRSTRMPPCSMPSRAACFPLHSACSLPARSRAPLCSPGLACSRPSRHLPACWPLSPAGWARTPISRAQLWH